MTIRFISKLILFPSLMTFVITFAHPQEDNLLQAIKNNSGTEVQQVLMDIVKQNQNDKAAESILLKAIMTGTTENIRQAVQPIIEQGKNNISPITWAILLKKPEAVKTLIECGAKVDETIVDLTIKMHDFQAALMLAQSNVDLSSKMDLLLQLACSSLTSSSEKSTALKLIQTLISKKNCDSNHIWQFSCKHLYHNVEAIKLLIDNGANPNYIVCEKRSDRSTQQSNLTNTPLFRAIFWSSPAAVKLLLEAGADVNQTASPNGKPLTPLTYAIHYSPCDANTKAKIVELLLELGAQLN